MSCHGCSAAFGFLNRERGCPNCGFSYCKKCLRYKISKGENDSSSVYVCKNCFDVSNNSKSEEVEDTGKKMNRQLSFSESTQVIKAIHRLQSLDNPSKPPIVVYSEESKEDIDTLRIGLTPEDQALVDRLANLRNEQKKRRKSEDPAVDIAMRLAQLRGDDPSTSSKIAKMNPLLVSKKPETEDELIARLSNAAALDKRYDEALTIDLEQRLSRLREPLKPKTNTGAEDVSNKESDKDGSSINVQPPEDEELTEEEQVQRIITRFQKEVDLEKSSGVPEMGSSTAAEESIEVDFAHDSEDDEDDPFCRICDAKATIICKECDGDEFCPKCFNEFHREIGETHKPTRLSKQSVPP